MRNIFIIWTIVLALIFAGRLNAQMQFEASEDYGQVFDVTFDPNHQNVIYARTVTNHIVKSSNKGADWEVIYSHPQENLYITIKDMRIINDGTALSFICTAEGTPLNKVVIFDLETETVTKEFPTPIGNQGGNLIQSYSLYEENNDVLLIHTTKMIDFGLQTEIYYTTDGGTNWEMVYTSLENGNIHVNNVAISPANSEKLFIMRGGSPNAVEGGLLISDDAGQTWTEKIAGTVYSAIAFNPTNVDDIFLGTFYLGTDQQENLYRSQDGGDTWEVVEINWTSMSNNSIHSITYNPLDLNQIMVLEENEIVVSYDRGTTWTNYVVETIDPENYYYGLTASFNPFVNNEVIICANYYPFISQNGGENLSRLKSPFVNPTGRLSVFGNGEQHVYYGLRNGIMHQDLAAGTEEGFNLVPINFTPNGSNSGVYADRNIAGRVYFSTMSGMMGSSALAMSEDHGENVSIILSGSYIMLVAVDSFEPNPNKVLASMGEIIYKLDVTDLENIVTQEIMPPSFGTVSSVLFDVADDNIFYVAQANKIYKTQDSGQTWTELYAVEEGHLVYDLKRNPLNLEEFAAATSVGVFISNDSGQNWTQIYDESPMNKIEFSSFANGKIVASSHFEDSGLFGYPASDAKTIYTKNNGETWDEIGTDELGYLRATSTDIMFTGENSADVYFQVQDLGLVKYTLDLTTLGNEEINSNTSDVTIYPNPTTGILNFNSKSEIQNIALFDLSGRKISESNSSQINISSLPKGIYLVKISTKDGKTTTKKVVKK